MNDFLADRDMIEGHRGWTTRNTAIALTDAIDRELAREMRWINFSHQQLFESEGSGQTERVRLYTEQVHRITLRIMRLEQRRAELQRRTVHAPPAAAWLTGFGTLAGFLMSRSLGLHL